MYIFLLLPPLTQMNGAWKIKFFLNKPTVLMERVSSAFNKRYVKVTAACKNSLIAFCFGFLWITGESPALKC